MSQYFPKPYVKFRLSNYSKKQKNKKKTDIKYITQVDTSIFALKSNLASLKIEVDKLGIDKQVPVHVDLSKLSHLGTNSAVKKLYFTNYFLK